MDAYLDGGNLALLRQAYLNNWQQYLASLDNGTRLAPWDLCVLTASSENQARAYRQQIQSRRRAGLLPRDTAFRVIPDPPAPDGNGGLRIGSGGATLRVLSEIAGDGPGPSGQVGLSAERVLVIHSGGDSRRLPMCSATGKLFARVPHELPDGRPSSLFDEFLVSLCGLPAQVPPGVLIASGDVLLLFDHLQLSFARPGVTGVAAAAPVATGTHHGVYVSANGGHRVSAFLHKPSLEELERHEAIDDTGRVQIDTGLVWLDNRSVQRMLKLGEMLDPALGRGVTINLYGDLLAPLAETTRLAPYLSDISDGPATPDLQDARRAIWSLLRELPLGVERLDPALFVHFGTTAEYAAVMCDGVRALRECGWVQDAASYCPPGWLAANASFVATNSCLESGDPGHMCLLDSHVSARLSAEGDGILSHVSASATDLALEPGIIIDALCLTDGNHVARLYAIADDPKVPLAQGGTWLSRPLRSWVEGGMLDEEDLWDPDLPAEQRTLWMARLYPVCNDAEGALAATLWLQAPEQAQPERWAAWREAERISLQESYNRADIAALIQFEGDIQDIVRARRYCAGLERELPADELKAHLGGPRDAPRRARMVADWLEACLDSWLPIRGYMGLARALDAHAETRDPRWEDRAFSSLARLVRAHTTVAVGFHPTAHRLPREAVVRLPARIDFGGGWTDTPPYSLERGGTVLNAAVSLKGDLPITARAELTHDPLLELHSRDIGATIRPHVLGDVLDYANPADPFALLKAALVFRGVVSPEADPQTPVTEWMGNRGFGLRLTTGTAIPRGSGLGTSSILAGAVLLALAEVCRPADATQPSVPREQLFDEVLCLEQMITTGGGWQDQIGGLVDGIKLIRTRPGLPQTAELEELHLSADTRDELSARMGLLYTGQRRLAKNLLRNIMSRWMAREPEMVAMLQDIAQLAKDMRTELLRGQLDAFGELLTVHWGINKRMDPGSSNPFIEELLDTCRPYTSGFKIAGAGGGGFAILVAHDADALGALADDLAHRYAGSQVGLWPCRIT